MKKERISNNKKHSGLRKFNRLFFFLFSLLPFLLTCVLGEDIETLRKRAEGEKKLPLVSFTVSFEADGGMPAPATQTVKAGGKAEEPQAMVKDGFSFGGWFKEAAFENRWDFDADTADGNIVLFARWENIPPDSYFVYFTANGGIPTPADQIIEIGGKVAEPEKMTKEGHAFGGWFKDSALENQWDFDTGTVSEGMTLYAKWVMLPPDTHLVIFIANGGSQIPDDKIIEDGSVIDRPDNPLREGFTFSGWYREAEFLSLWDFAADDVAKNEILYGKWETLSPGHYAIRFFSNGGSPFPEDQTVQGGEKLNEPAITKDGSTFGGWFKNPACTEPWLFNDETVTGNITLYAKWNQPGYYTVNFIANDGTLLAQQLAALGSTVNQAEIKREGYAFGGWYEDPGLMNEWDIASYKVTGNLNLFTKLLPINYAVVYDKNSSAAEGVMENSVHAYDESKALSACAFTRTGYTFAGWARAAGEAAEFTDCSEVFNLAAIEGAAVTLYAKWLPVSYSVKYDKNASDAEGQMADSLHVYDAEKALSKNVFIRQIEYTTFGGWNTEANGTGTAYTDEQIVVNLGALEGATVTLYAQWFSIADWLAAQPGGASVSDPVHLSLGSQLTEAAWLFILDEIAAAGKYVDLDLSACTRSGSSSGGGLHSNGGFDSLRDIATGKDRIVSIAMPDTVTNILSSSYSGAFRYFTNLTDFRGEGLSSLNLGIFRGCTNLTQIELPAGLTSISGDAFCDCTSLALTKLPAGITSIGSSAFSGCTSLALTELPAGLTSIGGGAFRNCTSLALTKLPAGITSISSWAFEGCTSLALTELPGITSIGSSAFQDCTSLFSLSLPASATIHYQNPFVGCISLSMFTLIGSGSLSTIENGKALVQNNSLIAYPSASGNVTLPEGIISIGYNAFYGCTSLTQIELPEGLISIDNQAFYKCTNLTLTELPAGLTSIGGNAFLDCTSLALTELPSGLTSIGNSAFSGCTGLTQIELPSGLTSIGGNAFYGCTGLTQIELPEGLTSIDGQTFSGCTGLTQIELPAGLTSIGDIAFSGCTGLSQIELPEGLTSIGERAFIYNRSLALVTCHAETPPEMGTSVFHSTHSSLQIKVPADSVDAYKAAPGWSEYADRISAIEG